MPSVPEVSATEVTVGEPIQWGKLIKTWATGDNYFEDEGIPLEELTVPRTLDELKRQARRVGADLTIPESMGIKALVVLTYSKDTLVIKLPPTELIKGKEGQLQGGGRYPFPSFYPDFVGRELTRDEKLRAHACRIGDYTISFCG